MSEKRDLEFYLANPEQMPADMGELNALMGDESLDKGEGDENELATTGEEGAASGAAGKEKVEAGSKTVDTAVAAGKDGEQGNAVLKSKDGKHEIPYSVLQAERERARTAEQAVEQMRAQLEALKTQATTGTAAKPEASESTDLSDEDMAQITNDFPAVGKLLKGMAAQVGQLTAQLQGVTQSEHNRRQAEANTASTSVQEAIDNSAHLSFWQQKDPAMFDVATKFDNQIKSDPRNKGLTLDQRFDRVVKAVEAVYGETELPAEFQRAAPTPAPAKTAAPKVDAKAIAAAAQKAIDDASNSSAVRTLSDIPGGIAGESDEVSQLGLMSASDLGNKFMSMPMEKMMAILAKAA